MKLIDKAVKAFISKAEPGRKHDAATPTFRSEIVARALPNARLVVFPDGTHVQIGALNLCAGQIMKTFIRDPNGALPLECLSQSRFPGFVLPDGTISR